MINNIDQYINSLPNFQEEMEKLREIVLNCGLSEELKWGKPCYSHGKDNVLILVPFKNYPAIGFFKGALLNDPNELLVQPGENSNAGRQMRFKDLQDILAKEAEIKAFIFEAIEVEKAGLQVEAKKLSDYSMPEELEQKFKEMPALKTAFEALTPGRQKAYIIHFAEAKQSKTRMDRIDKYTERILKGKGMLDCVCGLSKRFPNCDGSHKLKEK